MHMHYFVDPSTPRHATPRRKREEERETLLSGVAWHGVQAKEFQIPGRKPEAPEGVSTKMLQHHM